MANVHTVSGGVSGASDKVLSFETGKLAGLADGAVVARLGDTTVLVTATAARSVRDGIDFFPLTVDIEERSYAAGKIPGSFFRREGRAPDSAILTCRLIDRPLRPSFPEGFRNEVHVVGTVLGADMHNPYDVLAINGASAALMLSGIPFDGPIGAVRVAYTTDGVWLPHPTFEEGDESTFELVVAGRALDNGDVAIMMVEAGGTEKSFEYYADGAPKVDEAALAAGLQASKTWIMESIVLQRQLLDAAGRKPTVDYVAQIDYTDAIYDAVYAAGATRLAASQQISDKAARQAAENKAKAEILAELGAKFADEPNGEKYLKAAIRSVTKKIVRKRIVEEGVRIDGRGVRDIRPLSSEVGLLPTAHGSGLFQRGETQVLNICTLGMQRMDQMIDGIDPTTRKRYMHHYNFPPFSTGETGFMRGPKRREIGHGLLAERALFPVIPSLEDFPYTIRTVSEVLSSNGSTSMGSVCGSSLSLMDAGVPIKAPVAGIAMGLVYAEGKYTTLTDILGAEDAFGDMDFKVAGTADAVTALQLDTKIDGIPADVLAAALDQAKEARLAILAVMATAIAAPRDDVGSNAPKIISFEIPIDKIGEVIGPKGKVINAIQAETGASISVDDDGSVGKVSIASPDRDIVAEAERQIRLILNPPTAGVGEIYMGRVVNITKFGAFVNILPGRDGLVHISKLGGGKRIDRVEDVVDLGDEIEVRVEDIDPNGKISLVPVGAPAGEASPKADGPARASGLTAEAGEDHVASSNSGASSSVNVSFEDAFDAELAADLGVLGPESRPLRDDGGRRPSGDRGGRGGSRGGDRGGRSGGGGGRRR
ncbi:MAG: polyribonucleotide nucleotidyltransferase [Actinobacteria bacterium]|uniref:polyribonucleotide nucleotidyltransferase n=1 Tax=freshwater metagenome TaxID=449393 RepID=A0A6J7F4A1_9ZZZZ|nr:polyribonucleotide nucleotidyltransferase [Actinomycetota bacterium]MSW90218.1 polyribonucleotide nucleotidyltransferase [Actinomycetota bacterium]MSX88262.1 polyribonucleotide nucleotidyltransferase [Actinomycetota bacterium]MSY72365.1 polyribonucleotide nucleotidyltransferase [Actinomycetota bacterium]